MPLETLIVLQNQMDALSPRSQNRRLLLEKAAALHGVFQSLRCIDRCVSIISRAWYTVTITMNLE